MTSQTDAIHPTYEDIGKIIINLPLHLVRHLNKTGRSIMEDIYAIKNNSLSRRDFRNKLEEEYAAQSKIDKEIADAWKPDGFETGQTKRLCEGLAAWKTNKLNVVGFNFEAQTVEVDDGVSHYFFPPAWLEPF